MHVTFPKPEGAFYMFPDFSYYKDRLHAREIFTSVEFCDKLLEETGVAILPGSDFGRQPDEFTARLAYVDFNGEKALAAAAQSNGELLKDTFVETHCKRLVKAITKLDDWLSSL